MGSVPLLFLMHRTRSFRGLRLTKGALMSDNAGSDEQVRHNDEAGGAASPPANSGSACSPEEQALLDRLRQVPLETRLQVSMDMIGRMCAERRPPRMCIPVQWDDEDQYITETLQDALDKIVRLQDELSHS